MGRMRTIRTVALLSALAAALSSCAPSPGEQTALVRSPAPTTTTTFAPPAPAAAATPSPETTLAASPPPTPASTTSTAPRGPRVVHEQAWTPFAMAGPITLVHPSSRVERVGFHQSSHEGARELTTLPTAAAATTLETRERATAAQTSADVVVDPAVEIRSPVTGKVKRAGSYVLYCKHRDEYLVIAPDANPAWEVKVLHITGLQVSVGDRVVAGETVVARGPTQLPFESQVDELRTADPAWPHAHIEVVDPSIRNVPSPGGGC